MPNLNEVNRENGILNEERNILLEMAQDISGDKTIVAACAYGSRVAGYGRSDSDYDIILVLDDYKSKVKYVYVKDRLEVSALIVRARDLESDTDLASLGEFVIGRFLNTYDPLIGGKYLLELEKRYKKRIILETLSEIASTYGDFKQEISIPVEYFLFEKLKKRASLYPPALYSYSNTYSKECRANNLEASCLSFKSALQELEGEGKISYKNDLVTINDVFSGGRIKSKISNKFTDATRGVRSYATHGFAGRVGLNVVSREVISKLSRFREDVEIPSEIRFPKNLWSINEGVLINDTDDWLMDVSQAIGISKDFQFSKKRLGEIYNVSNLYTLHYENKFTDIVVKKFKDIRFMKWAFLNLWSLSSKRFTISPMSRLTNEYTAIRKLRSFGLNTPEIVAVILSEKILVTKFIDGINLGHVVNSVMNNKDSTITPVSLYGEAIGLVHNKGYALGDTKPNNSVFFDDEIYLTDLEQTGSGGDKPWDISEFVYYSTKLTSNLDGAKIVVEAFLDGYLKYGDPNNIEKALDLKLLAPFQPFMIPKVVKTIRKVMKEKACVI